MRFPLPSPRILAVPVAATIALGGLAGTASPASAATANRPAAKPTCTATPIFPKRFAFNRQQAIVNIGLKVTGPAVCHSTLDFQDVAGNFGVRKSLYDQYAFAWVTPYGTNATAFYASELKPGAQHLWGWACSVTTDAGAKVSCAVKVGGRHIWKFKGRVRVAARRSGATVTFTVHTRRYKAYIAPGVAGFVAESTHVGIQRKVGKRWVLVHRVKTNRRGVATFTVTRRARATYRVVSAPTRIAFGATSHAVA